MAKRSSKRKRTSKNIPGLSKKILKVLRNHHNQTFNYKQLADVLDITNANGRNQIIKKLATLVKSKQIAQAERGKFKINEEVNYYEGVLDMTTRKYGYVIVEELEEDVYIPQKNINKAFDGDRVKIYVYRKRTNK